MDRVVDYIRFNNKRSLALLLILAVLMAAGVASLGFWFGLSSIFVMYFFVGLFVFSTIEPKEWEASIIFVMYLAAAVLLIICFALVSMANSEYFRGVGTPESLISQWQHFYFSASMFTSLGFSDFKPISQEAQVFAVAQSLLGSAHGVTFILVMLGRKRWLGQPAQAVIPARNETTALELKMQQMAFTLRVVVGLLMLNGLALLIVMLK